MPTLKETADYIFWLLALQGASWIILGFLVIIFPLALFALVFAAFVWTGIITLVIAMRVRRHAADR